VIEYSLAFSTLLEAGWVFLFLRWLYIALTSPYRYSRDEATKSIILALVHGLGTQITIFIIATFNYYVGWWIVPRFLLDILFYLNVYVLLPFAVFFLNKASYDVCV